MKKLIFLYILFINVLVFGQNDLFRQANEAYKKGDYQKALSLYEKAMQPDKASGELYFNLGNAYYKLNQIAPSIYYYEKAKQLLPGDEDVRYNLQLANQMKLDKIDQVPENLLLRWKKRVNRIFSYDTWAWISVISAFLGLLAFGTFLFTRNANIKRLTFAGMFIALFLLLFAWYNAGYGKQLAGEKYAIVFAGQADLMTEPNLTSDKVATLHEGTKVKLIREDGDWELVKLPDGKKAWLPKGDIRVLD